MTSWRTDEATAMRFRDGIAFHRAILSVEEIRAGRVVAVSLETGAVSPEVFESRTEAVKFQRVAVDANQVAYIPMPLERWNEKACDILLWYWRTVYKNQGYRPAGAHAGTTLIIPNRVEELGL